MVRLSIYYTICTKQCHSPICRYRRLPQGPYSRTHYMEYFPETAKYMLHVCLYIRSWKSANVTITESTTLLRQYLSHCRIMYPTLAPLSASAVPQWPLFLTWFNSPCLTWFDWTCLTLFVSLCLTWFKLLCLTWFESLFLTWFDTLFSGLIQLTVFDWIWLSL